MFVFDSSALGWEIAMGLLKRYNEIMGPKDERLVAEENRAMKVSANILLIGSVLSLYYAIMLGQVASTTDHPILTPLGQSVVSADIPLLLTILVAGVVSVAMQTKAGFFSTRKRFAEVDRIPWDFVSLFALACGAIVGVLTCTMRILAEIQIVGLSGVAWLGDAAIGIVFFIMGFVIGFVAIALSISDAIKARRRMEEELFE